jgi:transposase
LAQIKISVSYRLREIAKEMTLGLNTVRTIVGQAEGTDRTSRRHRGGIEIDRQQIAQWKRQRRTGDFLPRRAQKATENSYKLVKEAKGLGLA